MNPCTKLQVSFTVLCQNDHFHALFTSYRVATRYTHSACKCLMHLILYTDIIIAIYCYDLIVDFAVAISNYFIKDRVKAVLPDPRGPLSNMIFSFLLLIVKLQTQSIGVELQFIASKKEGLTINRLVIHQSLRKGVQLKIATSYCAATNQYFTN